jgi:ADP-ribosylation factor-like protein 1
VVDSTDIERLQTAAEELSAMLNEEELKDAALLVFANKQDQPGAKGAGEISEALRLGELRDRNWSIMACSAVDGSGVNEGMDWLVVSPSQPLGLLTKRGEAVEVAANDDPTANRQLGVDPPVNGIGFVTPIQPKPCITHETDEEHQTNPTTSKHPPTR